MNRWRMCWWRTCLYRNSWSKQKTSCWRLGWRRCQTRRTEVSVSILTVFKLLNQVINVCAGGFLGQQTVPEELNVKRHTIQEGNGVNEPQESFRSVRTIQRLHSYKSHQPLCWFSLFCRSLIARNERLLQQLEEALMNWLLQMKNGPPIDS